MISSCASSDGPHLGGLRVFRSRSRTGLIQALPALDPERRLPGLRAVNMVQCGVTKHASSLVGGKVQCFGDDGQHYVAHDASNHACTSNNSCFGDP